MANFEIVAFASETQEWDAMLQNSFEGNIFFSQLYLQNSSVPFSCYIVQKGQSVKAGFVVLEDPSKEQSVLDELIIYSGIFFLEDPTHKESKVRAQRFAISEAVIEFLDTHYTKIAMQLSPQFEDIRPFLWHNYHAENLNAKFRVDVRYTSYLNIAGIRSGTNGLESSVFKGFDTIRQRNIKEARKKSAYTKIELQLSLFMQYYEALLASQEITLSIQKRENMARLIAALIQNNKANMYISYNAQAQVQYITIFCWDHKRAYYLFGAPNPEAGARYKGSICFWDAFVDLAQRGVDEVDLEGVNSPQRGWFKLSFGGDLRSYFRVVKG